MSILKKDFGYGGERLKSYSAQPLRLGGMNRRANFASAGRRIGKSKARPAQMAVRREKRYTCVCAIVASRQMSRERRRLFPTKFALL